jgi:hypothetical protein
VKILRSRHKFAISATHQSLLATNGEIRSTALRFVTAGVDSSAVLLEALDSVLWCATDPRRGAGFGPSSEMT